MEERIVSIMKITGVVLVAIEIYEDEVKVVVVHLLV